MIHKQSSFGCDVDFVKFFIVLVAVKMLMMLVYEINEGLSSLHHDKKNLSYLLVHLNFQVMYDKAANKLVTPFIRPSLSVN